MFTNPRLIAGRFKGIKLSAPEAGSIHPMGERERNALFNTLGDLTGAEVLDLYAGTGALGLEALSRGAERATFVEKSPAVVKSLYENVVKIAPKNAKILIKTAAMACENLEHRGSSFDVIFADPPYDEYRPEAFMAIADLLEANGRFVLSSPSSEEAPELAGLSLISSRVYAGARISFYSKS